MNPPPRAGHVAAFYKDFLIVTGGKNNNGALCDAWIYTTSSSVHISKGVWSDTNLNSDLLCRSNAAFAVVEDNKLFMYGGIGKDGKDLSDLVRLDLDTLTIASVQFSGVDGPGALNDAMMTSVNTTLYIFGGLKEGVTSNSTYEFDTVSKQWAILKLKGITPPPLSSGVMSRLDDHRLIVSGGRDSLGQASNLNFILDVERGSWIWIDTISFAEGIGSHAGFVFNHSIAVYPFALY